MSRAGIRIVLVASVAACLSSEGPSSPSPEEEHCTLAFEGSIPEWNATTIYDVQLRNSETDPDYDDRLGTSMVFADEQGISIFTLTSFVRTTLSGEILLRKPIENMRVQDVQSGDDGVYGALVQYDGSHRFCTIPKDGTFDFDVEFCVAGFNGDTPFTWLAPYFYVVEFDEREQVHSVSQINTSGTVVSIRNSLPTGASKALSSIELHRVGEELLVLSHGYYPSEACPTVVVASVPTTVVGGQFESIMPEHYKSGVRRSMTAGPASTAIRYEADCAVGGRSTCDSPSPVPLTVNMLTMMDSSTGALSTSVFPFYSYNLIWDGENFANFVIADDEFQIYLFNSFGKPVGHARWPLGFGVEVVSGTGFAAIAPNDYVLTFHAAPLASQERLIRVKIAPK